MTAPAKALIGVTPSSGWVAAGIRLVTRSHYAHAFLATGNGDEIIEADPHGARYAHASTYPKVKWLTHLADGLTDAQRDAIVAWAATCTTGHGPDGKHGVPYSWVDDAAIGLRDVFHWVPGFVKRRLGNDSTLMCSQLAVAAYRAGGVDLYPGLPDGGVSPGDLNRLDDARAKVPAMTR